MFWIVYTLAWVAAGGYVTAWLAPRAKALHATILGVLATAMTIGVMMNFLGAQASWSYIAQAGLIIPAAWLGGMLRTTRPTTTKPIG